MDNFGENLGNGSLLPIVAAEGEENRQKEEDGLVFEKSDKVYYLDVLEDKFVSR